MAEDAILASAGGEAAYWNSMAARPWAEQHERQDRALTKLAARALELAAPRPGERVLDIGCGAGTTLLELAARVGPGGHVTGADIAQASVARAGERITAAGLRNAEAICADVERHAFATASFDLVFSRLGVMFFADPAAAFANVHRAMKLGGRMTLAVFRAQRENPWPSAPQQAVAHLLPPPPPGRPNAAAMFSLGDPVRVRRLLEDAGFGNVSLTPVDFDYLIAGPDGGAAEAAEFAMQFGPLTRILPELSPARRSEVRAALDTFFRNYATAQGVALPAAFWVVQALA